MNTKQTLYMMALAAWALLGTEPLMAQVRSPEDRLEVIEKARQLVHPEMRMLEEFSAGIVSHPFHPRSDVVIPGEAVHGVLARIAAGISVDGAIQMGGVRYLLLQGRRVGPGDYLPVQFEGRTYQVRIGEVTASSYTLRLNDEEIEKNL